METWRAFRSFCSSVLSHWISLSTGGLVIAGLGGFEHFTGVSIPWSAYALLVTVFFAWACFLAFQDQYTAAVKLQGDLSSAVSLASKAQEKNNDFEALQQSYKAALLELSVTKAEVDGLQQRLGPPYPFSMPQRKKLIEVLSEFPTHLRFPVTAFYPGLGGGSVPARVFAQAFTDAGWQAQARSHMLLNPDVSGVTLSLSDEAFAGQEPLPEKVEVLTRLLRQAGVEHRIGRMGPGADLPDDRFVMIVAEA